MQVLFGWFSEVFQHFAGRLGATHPEPHWVQIDKPSGGARSALKASFHNVLRASATSLGAQGVLRVPNCCSAAAATRQKKMDVFLGYAKTTWRLQTALQRPVYASVGDSIWSAAEPGSSQPSPPIVLNKDFKS